MFLYFFINIKKRFFTSMVYDNINKTLFTDIKIVDVCVSV